VNNVFRSHFEQIFEDLDAKYKRCLVNVSYCRPVQSTSAKKPIRAFMTRDRARAPAPLRAKRLQK